MSGIDPCLLNERLGKVKATNRCCFKQRCLAILIPHHGISALLNQKVEELLTVEHDRVVEQCMFTVRINNIVYLARSSKDHILNLTHIVIFYKLSFL